MAKKITLRQCVGCGEMKDKKEMMRVLKTAEGPIVLDMSGRKNGRGAYLCKDRECLRKAMKKKGLERSFKMSIPDEIYENLEKEFEEGEHEVKGGKACLVVIAEDASGNTRKKYSNMCKFYEVPYAYHGTKGVLGHSMGREERSVLAVTDEGFADSIRKHLVDSE